MTEAEIHNQLAPRIVVDLVKAAGSPQNVLVTLESVVAGVCTYVAASTTGGQTPDQVFALIASAMPERLADISRRVLPPQGRA
jgi:hypothetical protein